MGKCIEWMHGWVERNRDARGAARIGRFFCSLGAALTSRTVYGALRICSAVVIVFAVIAYIRTGRFFYLPAVATLYAVAFYLFPKLWRTPGQDGKP